MQERKQKRSADTVQQSRLPLSQRPQLSPNVGAKSCSQPFRCTPGPAEISRIGEVELVISGEVIGTETGTPIAVR